MAEARKGADPFEAFKQKKATQERQAREQLANDDAAKKLGWVEGIGPGEAKQDPTKPKGFAKGRFAKPPVNPAELAKLKPAKYDATNLAKPTTTNVEKLPPAEKRRPKKFDRY
jgi:hypothetical protein